MVIEEIYQLYLNHPVVTTDSRNCPQGSLFFALKGESFNGNLYAQQALEQGCSYAFVDEALYADDNRIILVDNVLITLQQLANYHRRQLGIPVLCITGTNGKTTTKELTAAVLSRKFNVLFTQGNLNNHIGVPLTLLKMNSTHELAVIETGANHPGEIGELAAIAEPDFGLITNVGKAHLEGFGSFEGVIRTKGELYQYIRVKGGKIFIHAENQYLKEIAQDIDRIEYGESDGLYITGRVTGCSSYLEVSWMHDHSSYEIKTQLIGAYNLTNVLAAVAIGIYFGVNPGQICTALSEYKPQNNRSQLTKTERNSLIVDAYNANPSSMKAAVTNFAMMKAERKVLLLGDMRELGETSHEEHQALVDLIASYSFDQVLLCGENFAQTRNGFTTFASRDDLIDYLKKNPVSDSAVLIKGSRGMQLEKCLSEL